MRMNEPYVQESDWIAEIMRSMRSVMYRYSLSIVLALLAFTDKCTETRRHTQNRRDKQSMDAKLSVITSYEDAVPSRLFRHYHYYYTN